MEEVEGLSPSISTKIIVYYRDALVDASAYSTV